MNLFLGSGSSEIVESESEVTMDVPSSPEDCALGVKETNIAGMFN